MRTAFVSSFQHQVHLAWAEDIDADIFHFRDESTGVLDGTILGDVVSGYRWPEYDVYIIEGSAPLYSAFSNSVASDSIVIYLGADRGMYALSSASGQHPDHTIRDVVIRRIGKYVGRSLSQSIDGVISVSDFVADYTRLLTGPDTPIRVAHPYIHDEPFEELGDTSPALEDNVAVTVGRDMHYKGFDELIEAWPTVREAHPSAELRLVGPGNEPGTYADVDGVDCLGYVDSVAHQLSEASLFVQPSLGDAFPVSTLEALQAGLPPIVTQTTGTRSEVRAVSGDLVVDNSPHALAEGIVDYFDRPAEERRELSRRARERGARFDPDSRKQAFADAFHSLLDEIEA
ncbi:glycosyltransferase family 4 protein [Haloplanus pelagicus]|uniref:glycosyltransferase family 4 protein n=1 Tax=Haloplanus pelagicus TaxID=2949995 RepID=UPI00203C9129|nr:glycosyltransferase family 4 protein [Haloplanus sp. HW8-1]